MQTLTLRSQVNTDSRYGTNAADVFRASAKAAITLPSVSRLLLMLTPSRNRSPLAHVWLTRSLPARSTRLILLRRVCIDDDGLLSVSETEADGRMSARFRTMLKIEWERELLSFIPVAAVARWLFPTASQFRSDVWESTGWVLRSTTYGPQVGCSRTRRAARFGAIPGVLCAVEFEADGETARRSWIFSL